MDLMYKVVAPATPLELKAQRILLQHIGRQNAISVPELAYELGTGDFETRQLIKHLVEMHYWPIGSATSKPPGYYIITDKKELNSTKYSLIHRALSILGRARVYDKAGWVQELMGQISLKLGDEEKTGGDER